MGNELYWDRHLPVIVERLPEKVDCGGCYLRVVVTSIVNCALVRSYMWETNSGRFPVLWREPSIRNSGELHVKQWGLITFSKPCHNFFQTVSYSSVPRRAVPYRTVQFRIAPCWGRGTNAICVGLLAASSVSFHRAQLRALVVPSDTLWPVS